MRVTIQALEEAEGDRVEAAAALGITSTAMTLRIMRLQAKKIKFKLQSAHSTVKFMPTQEQIAEACAEIRRTWTESEYQRRSHIKNEAAELPEINLRNQMGLRR